MEAAVLKQALEWYFKQQDLEVTSCDIIKGVAYIQFGNQSGKMNNLSLCVHVTLDAFISLSS